MQNYELLAIFPGTLSETEVSPSVEKVQQLLTENGAQNLEMKDMGKSRLAYPVRHIRYGYFYVGRFQAEQEVINKLKDKLKLMPELLRALVNKYDPKISKEGKIVFAHVVNTEKTPMMEARNYDEVAANVSRAPKAKVEEVETVEIKEEEPVEVTEVVEEVTAETVEPVSEVKEEAKTVAPVKKTTRGRKAKVTLDDIDKKLDEILDIDLEKV